MGYENGMPSFLEFQSHVACPCSNGRGVDGSARPRWILSAAATGKRISTPVSCNRRAAGDGCSKKGNLIPIEEVWRQKARQNVGVLDWGARSNATLEIFGVIV